MPDGIDSLILDLLEWIGAEPRPYAEVMDAWRTSCPRLTVWEEANARGYVRRHYEDGAGAMVSVTALGMSFLGEQRPPGAEPGAFPRKRP